MILSVGEILVDMIGSEKDGAFCYERKAGGAPFRSEERRVGKECRL